MHPRDILFLIPDCLRAAEDELLSGLKQHSDFSTAECYSSGTWTLPAHATLYTAEPANEHLAVRRGDTLEQTDPALPQKAREHGYTTALVSENPTFGTANGFGHGIDVVDEDVHLKRFATKHSPAQNIDGASAQAAITVLTGILWSGNIPKNAVNALSAAYSRLISSPPPTEFPHHGERVLNHLSTHLNQHENIFAITNLLDTHNPHYCPPEAGRNRTGMEISPGEIAALESASDNRGYLFDESLPSEAKKYFPSWDAVQARKHEVYRAQVAYIDQLITEWLEEHRDQLTDALVITVGDHGQMFGAEGMVGHHTSLHPHGIAVPVYVSFPDDWLPVTSKLQTPVSLTGLARATKQVLTGTVTSAEAFLDSWAARDVVCCVDGPTWRVNELCRKYGSDDPSIDRLSVRKVGVIEQNKQTVYSKRWDSDDIVTETYTITDNSREPAETNPIELTDAQRRWLQDGKPSQISDNTSSRLEALGYK